MKSKQIAFLNGPNLNLLGQRKPEIYGSDTLPQIESRIAAAALKAGYLLWNYQTNDEGALVEAVHTARKQCRGIIINPGAYSHTSIALRDALETFPGPIIEVHLSDIKQREEFRRHSFVSDVAAKVICGQGANGYMTALTTILELLI